MAFKMKAGKKGPMYKNFPSAFKAEEKIAKKVNIPTVTIEEKKNPPKVTKVKGKLTPTYIETSAGVRGGAGVEYYTDEAGTRFSRQKGESIIKARATSRKKGSK
tara:strand:- start:2780 stop:3091 length:312 start_codon:yes stop_codon:yes gene_type:complete